MDIACAALAGKGNTARILPAAVTCMAFLCDASASYASIAGSRVKLAM